jgi:hypothetical protein
MALVKLFVELFSDIESADNTHWKLYERNDTGTKPQNLFLKFEK